VLLVEDNPSDADLLVDVFSEAGAPPHKLSIVRDGVEALAFLHREGAYADAPRPGLIILDLNVPRKDGREVLADLKADPDLRAIPVVVLSSSEAKRDLDDVYRLHGNCFVTKPPALDDFLRTLRFTRDYWLETVRLPGR
jgi:CheY-like chemotaxis protein